MVEPGDSAPRFELANQRGEPIRLAAFAGRWVVLWFFPRVDTDARPYDDPWANERRQRDEPPRCTQQACAFRDTWEAFEERNVAVLGISVDSVADLRAFANDFELPFDVLSDPEGAVADRYGSFGTKVFEGREYEIAFRNTFIINDSATIVHVDRDVSAVKEHPEEVLDELGARR